jgi:LPS-assembly protein
MPRKSALCLGALLATVPLPVAAAGAERGSQVPVLFSADEVQYDEDLGLVVAKGHVELSQRDQILLADAVTYNQRTDTVTASGHVSLLQVTGDIVFADFVELHDNMRDGFIRNVRMLLSDRSRMAGNTARRVDGNRTEVRRGVYSPCEPCAEDSTRAPIWQIKAEEIVHDKELQLVEYRDAVMEIDGIPVLWTPYFSHPDPSVKRHSGFLAPHFGNSTLLGLNAGIPYYWVIDDNKDATITPEFTSAGGTFLGGQYRQRFGFGKFVADGSVTVGSTRSNAVDTQSVEGLRWHVNTSSEFDLTQDWRAGANVARVSDQTYLLRYRLPLPVDFLSSQVYAENFGRRSYTNISAWGFQSLIPGVSDRTQPFAAPLADYQWVSEPDRIGGRLAVEGNALDLVREQGINTRRASLGTEWRLPFDGGIGDRYALTIGVRGDGYHSDNLPITTATPVTQSSVDGRVFPQLAFSWRYPWVRRGESYSQLIEPMAMLAAAPNGGNPGRIPNEDSQGFEFDETSLFLRNRFPGFDRVDGGQRVDYGLRAGIYGDGGGSTRLLVGQSYALQKNDSFLAGSGLDHHLSDVVGRLSISPASYLNLTYRFRLDREDLALRRQEISGSAGPSNLQVSLSYIQIAPIPDVPDLQKRKQLAAVITAGLTRYWSMQLIGTRDFAPIPPPGTTVGTTETLNSGIQLTYRDECVTFITSLTQSGIRNGDVVPGTSLLFTVVFKNLGDVGTKLASFGGF